MNGLEFESHSGVATGGMVFGIIACSLSYLHLFLDPRGSYVLSVGWILELALSLHVSWFLVGHWAKKAHTGARNGILLLLFLYSSFFLVTFDHLFMDFETCWSPDFFKRTVGAQEEIALSR